MRNDIEKIIGEVQKKPDNYSTLEHAEYYDGWKDAIEYVVSILEKYKDLGE